MQTSTNASRKSAKTGGKVQCRGVPPFARRLAFVPKAAAGSSDIVELRHKLPDGLSLEVLQQQESTSGAGSKPPLIFVHGSYHAAWCWREKFMPYFSENGWDVYAISLRAQGNSDMVKASTAGAAILHWSPIRKRHFHLPLQSFRITVPNTISAYCYVLGQVFSSICSQHSSMMLSWSFYCCRHAGQSRGRPGQLYEYLASKACPCGPLIRWPHHRKVSAKAPAGQLLTAAVFELHTHAL